jgi:hypothetical protein
MYTATDATNLGSLRHIVTLSSLNVKDALKKANEKRVKKITDALEKVVSEFLSDERVVIVKGRNDEDYFLGLE